MSVSASENVGGAAAADAVAVVGGTVPAAEEPPPVAIAADGGEPDRLWGGWVHIQLDHHPVHQRLLSPGRPWLQSRPRSETVLLDHVGVA